MTNFDIAEAFIALQVIPDLGLQKNLPLKDYSYFQAGGPAELAVFPKTSQALIAALKVARDNKIPVTVLGRGSNILVADQGISGLVIFLRDNFSEIKQEGDHWRIQAGAPLYEVGARLAAAGQRGGEFLVGIPGSMGGAALMNAGAYDGSMEDIVEKIIFINEDLEFQELSHDQCEFAYRHSYFSDNTGIITELIIKTEPGDIQEIYETIFDIQHRRRNSQPLDMPSGGSSFKRPEGAYAAKLISDVGLKGKRWGKAGVSDKHSGFIVNYGGATSTEIYEVFKRVRETVAERTGFELEMEVRMIGDWQGD